jgi:type II secretory pathway component PulF
LPTFVYQAIDSMARDVRGLIAADSPREARDRLRGQGLLVEALSQQKLASRRWLTFQRPGRHATQLAMAIRELGTLLGTGIGLVEALDTLCAQYRGRFQSSLSTVRERVANGSNLSDAMQADAAVYDELTVHMVRVGENAGTLDAVLDQLAEFRERYLLFKDRCTQSLILSASERFMGGGSDLLGTGNGPRTAVAVGGPSQRRPSAVR